MSQTVNVGDNTDFKIGEKLPGPPPQHKNEKRSLATSEGIETKWWRILSLVILVQLAGWPSPNPVAFLGWDAGFVTYALYWIVAVYFLLHVVKMHEISQREIDLSHEPGQETGVWTRISQDTIAMVGANIVCLIIGGRCLMKSFEIVKGSNQGIVRQTESNELSLVAWVGVAATPQFILALFPNHNPIAALSLAAVTMFSSYSSVAWANSFFPRKQKAGYSSPDPMSESGWIYLGGEVHVLSQHYPDLSLSYDKSLLCLLAIICLLYLVWTCTAIIVYRRHISALSLEDQSTNPAIPSTVSSKAEAMYLLCLMHIIQIIILIFWGRRDLGYQNFVWELELKGFSIYTFPAIVAVVIFATGNYQYFAKPVYKSLEMTLAKRLSLTPSRLLQLVTRWSYVFLTGLVACALLLSVNLLHVLELFVFAPTTCVLPFIVWLKVNKPKPFSLAWTVNVVCIVSGVLAATFILANSYFDGVFSSFFFSFVSYSREFTSFVKDFILVG